MSWLSRLTGIFARGRTLPSAPHDRSWLVNPMEAGVPATPATAMTAATVFACVRRIAEDVGNLPWHAYRRDGKTRIQVPDLEALLSLRANDEMGARTFRETLIAHALTWGNGYAEIERNRNNRAVALHLLTPERVEPKRTTEGVLYYEVTAATGGPPAVIPARDMFHLKGMGYDGVRGYSVVNLAARAIGINLAMDTTAARFFGNGANVSLAIEVPAGLTPEGLSRLNTAVTERYTGPRNAFKPLILDTGMKAVPLTMPFTDAQFLESRNFAVEEVCRWFSVPPHKVGHLARATFSNIEHQGLDYVQAAPLTWARRLEEEADLKLTPGTQAEYTKLNLAGLLRADAKTRGEFYQLLRNMGALSVNEIRSFEDLDPIGPDGDVYVMQQQYVPLEQLGKAPEQTGAGPEVAPGMTEDEPAQDADAAAEPPEPPPPRRRPRRRND